MDTSAPDSLKDTNRKTVDIITFRHQGEILLSHRLRDQKALGIRHHLPRDFLTPLLREKPQDNDDGG